MRTDQVDAGLEAAVGDDDGCRSEPGGARGRVRLDLDSARTESQRAGAHPAEQPALPPPQVLLETLQRNVAGISSPVEAKPFAPWRSKHIGLVAAEIDEIDALGPEPLHQPAAVPGGGARQILAGKPVGAGFDLVD